MCDSNQVSGSQGATGKTCTNMKQRKTARYVIENGRNPLEIHKSAAETYSHLMTDNQKN